MRRRHRLPALVGRLCVLCALCIPSSKAWSDSVPSSDFPYDVVGGTPSVMEQFDDTLVVGAATKSQVQRIGKPTRPIPLPPSSLRESMDEVEPGYESIAIKDIEQGGRRP